MFKERLQVIVFITVWLLIAIGGFYIHPLLGIFLLIWLLLQRIPKVF